MNGTNEDQQEKETERQAPVPGTDKSDASNAPAKAKNFYDQFIFKDWCKACGICTAFCPKHVIGRNRKGTPVILRPDECIGCRFCELHCPDFAITVRERNGSERRRT